MDAIMYCITEYFWIFIIAAIFLLISVLGIYVEGRKEKAEIVGEKIDQQIMEEAQRAAEEKKNQA